MLANTNEVQAIKTQDQIMANIWNKASLLGGLLEIDQPVSLVIKDLGENTYQLTATDPRQSDEPINFNFKYPVHIRKKQADGFLSIKTCWRLRQKDWPVLVVLW